MNREKVASSRSEVYGTRNRIEYSLKYKANPWNFYPIGNSAFGTGATAKEISGLHLEGLNDGGFRERRLVVSAASRNADLNSQTVSSLVCSFLLPAIQPSNLLARPPVSLRRP